MLKHFRKEYQGNEWNAIFDKYIKLTKSHKDQHEKLPDAEYTVRKTHLY